MRAMASTVLATTWPPRSATSRVLAADWLAAWAFSAFFFTVKEISSIEAEVSSRLAACSSVRCDRSVVLPEISAEALVTSRAEIGQRADGLLQLRHRGVEVLLELDIGLREIAGQAERQVAGRQLLQADAKRFDGVGLLFRRLGTLLGDLRLHVGFRARELGLPVSFDLLTLHRFAGFGARLFISQRLETFDRVRHLADLVLAIETRQYDRKVAGGDLQHCLLKS